jgi:Flp pilus assembly protein TadB
MDILNARLWIVFYLICFVAVLWATFLLVQGFMLVLSVAMVGIVLGFNCILLVGEIRAQIRKKKEMERFLKGYIAGSDEPATDTGRKNA